MRNLLSVGISGLGPQPDISVGRSRFRRSRPSRRPQTGRQSLLVGPLSIVFGRSATDRASPRQQRHPVARVRRLPGLEQTIPPRLDRSKRLQRQRVGLQRIEETPGSQNRKKCSRYASGFGEYSIFFIFYFHILRI